VKRLISSDRFSVNGGITQASGTAEREAALAKLAPDASPPHHARRRQGL